MASIKYLIRISYETNCIIFFFAFIKWPWWLYRNRKYFANKTMILLPSFVTLITAWRSNDIASITPSDFQCQTRVAITPIRDRNNNNYRWAIVCIIVFFVQRSWIEVKKRKTKLWRFDMRERWFGFDIEHVVSGRFPDFAKRS